MQRLADLEHSSKYRRTCRMLRLMVASSEHGMDGRVKASDGPVQSPTVPDHLLHIGQSGEWPFNSQGSRISGSSIDAVQCPPA